MIPFDDGTVQRLATFNSTLSFVESYLRANILPRNDLFIFLGNSAPSRNKHKEAEKLGKKALRSSFNKSKSNMLSAERQTLLEKIKKAHYEFELSGSKDLTLKILKLITLICKILKSFNLKNLKGANHFIWTD